MHEAPEVPKPNGSPQGEPRELVSPEVLRLLEREAREGRERRAESRRDEVVWRRLQRADAALRVEDYFRSGPLHPSLRDIISTIDLPAGAVDKEFLRACGVIAERFRRQSEDTNAALEKLKESVRKRGLLPNAETLGRELYKDIMRDFPLGKADALRLVCIYGFLFLSVDNNQAYDDLYNERTPDEESGGRFHRAQMVNVANRSVPLVTRRGALAGRAEDDAVMIHEIQHWISEGLVGLGDMETPRPSMLRLSQKERKEILDRDERRRPIKDEILAYLRQGQITNLKEILDGKLYQHLFEGNPAEDVQNRLLVANVSAALMACIPFIAEDPRLTRRMTYALIDVPLESFKMHIDAIRFFLERVGRLLREQHDVLRLDISFVQWVPRKYASAKDQFVASQAVLSETYVDIESLVCGAHVEDGGALRTATAAFRGEAIAVKDAYAALRPNDTFVPFVSSIEGRDAHTPDEYTRENECISDILDCVDAFSKDRIESLCEHVGAGAYPRHEHRATITDLITLVTEHVVEKEGLDYPNVSIFVSDLGVQIAIGYSRQTSRGLGHLYTLVNVPSMHVSTTDNISYARPPGDRELSWGEQFFDQSFFAKSDEYIPHPLPKRYVAVYQALQHSGEERDRIRDAIYAVRKSSSRDLVEQRRFNLHVKELQRVRKEYEYLREGLFVNGAHIPQVYEWDIPGLYYPREIVPVVKQSLEKLSAMLFDTARSIEQDIVDDWIDAGSTHENDSSRCAAIQDILLASVGTSFGSGKIQKIVLHEMSFEHDRIMITLGCSIQERHGTWLDGRSTIVLHRRRAVATPSVLR